MRLAQRLWLHGAAIPAALLAVALVATAAALHALLLHAIDDGLRSQAAVEAVSLFDLRGGHAHLHLDRSDVARRLGEPPAETALYGSDGRLLFGWPEPGAFAASVPALAAEATGGSRAPPDPADAQPVTVATPLGDARELRLLVRSPTGQPHLLLLRRSLAEHDAAVRGFAFIAALALLLVSAALVAQAWAQVRSLGQRIDALLAHVARVGRGELDADPPADAGGDEIAALRDALRDATAARRRARTAEARLLADAAHELRTPLATMRLELDLALRGDRDGPALRDALASVRDEVDRLARLAGDLLTLRAGRAMAAWEVVDLAAIAAASVERAGLAAGAQGPAVRLDARAGACLTGDADALGRVFDNLLDNARRFAEGAIDIHVGHDPADPHWIVAWVQDDGPGVPAEQAEAVFAPFHRLRRDQPGAGLGLAIVRDVIERHGGSIAVTAAPRGGARFVWRLPAVASGGPGGEAAARVSRDRGVG